MPCLRETCGFPRKIHTKGDRRLPHTGEKNTKGRVSAAFRKHSARAAEALLDLHRGAGLFELALDRVGLLAGDCLLDRARGPVDEVLRLLQPEVRDCAD